MASKWMTWLRANGIVWKIPLTSALSWELAEWAGSKHPYLAPLSAILCIQSTIDQSIRFAWHRMVGTFAGVLFTVWIAPYLALNGWSLALLLLAGTLLASWLKWDQVLMTQVGLSILLVLFFHSRMPTYWSDRIRDTLIGTIAATAIHALILPPDTVNQARKKLRYFMGQLTASFHETAQWVQNGCPQQALAILQNRSKTLFQEMHRTTAELENAEQSLKFHALAGKKRQAVEQMKDGMLRLRAAYVKLGDMIQAFSDWSGSGTFSTDQQREWSSQLTGVADLVRKWQTEGNLPVTVAASSLPVGLRQRIPARLQNDQYLVVLCWSIEQLIQQLNKPVH
ncbi:aromatic acid exporter family protein [Cohnella sp. AR92]|uniref:FUSC family protein n=1 Tax=Cohnella sp. AR92 TaxID=648716 RepID=UPI000F8D1590|nr:FUSC family protein [Cohnella sp. AR92]RUS46900.1 FUSC family protein [Cohnella sp. AR92]